MVAWQYEQPQRVARLFSRWQLSSGGGATAPAGGAKLLQMNAFVELADARAR
jgi:hypothetical protein